jgi:hypothetical protein
VVTDHEHVWVEAVVVQAPELYQEAVGVTYAICGVCGQGKGADQRPAGRAPTYDFLHAQADALEATADWADQPDSPTGCNGALTSMDLRMRAIALRVQADVLYGEGL